MKKSFIIGLMVILLSVLIYSGYSVFNKMQKDEMSYVIIDINPSIQLVLDKNEGVVDVVSINEDADKLLSNVNLVGMKLELASEKIMEEAINMGYIDEYSNINTITVTTVSNLENVRQDLEAKVIKRLNDVSLKREVNSYVVAKGVTEDLKQQAIENNVSNGKMLLVERAISLNPDLNKDTLITLSIKDIQKEIINKVATRNILKKEQLIEEKNNIINENIEQKSKFEEVIKNEYIKQNPDAVKNKQEVEIIKEAIRNKKQEINKNFENIKTDILNNDNNIKNSHDKYGNEVNQYPVYVDKTQTEQDANKSMQDKVSGELNDTTRVIVLFKTGVNKKVVEQAMGKINREFMNVPALAITIPKAAINGLKNNPNVKIIETDIKVKVSGQTQDWGIPRVEAPDAWKSGLTGKGIKISIVDTGISKHDDLVISGGVSYTSYTTSYHDDNGHGTHVAGIIGARNNTIGTVGIAPEANIYAVKVLGSDGSGYLSDVIAGIDWSISNKMNIINLSLGTSTASTTLQQVVDKAYSQNIIVVAAAGNSGTSTGSGDNVEYPARYSSVIAVSATDSYDKRASFSSTGSTVEVAGPGVNVLSTYKNNSYAKMSGTSMSTPYVSGNIALLKQIYPTLSASNLRSKLQTSIFDLGTAGKDAWFGYGLIKAPKVTTTTEPTTEPIADPITSPSPTPTITLGTVTTVSTNKTVYLVKEKVYIKAIVKDSNGKVLADASVKLTLKTSTGTPITSTNKTNSSGEVTFTFATRQKTTKGTYDVIVDTTKEGYTSSNATTKFELQ